MNVRLRLALLGSLMVAASVVRCGGTTQSGSESHFLAECAATSECEQGLECECGVCTRSCAADTECDALAASARCVQRPGCETTICDAPDAGNREGGAGDCQGSVEAYCASRSACVSEWPPGERALCGQDPRVLNVAVGCGARNIARYQGTDTRALYYYDSSTGQLVAITSHTLGTTSCVAGPPDFDAALAETAAYEECSWMSVGCLDSGSTDARADAAGGCDANSECSDFIFCNGAEVCGADHACQAGTPPDEGTFCGQDRICQAGDCVVAPSPTEWTSCTDEACLCDGLAACAAVERQVALPLGSMGSRVCGVQGDQCVVSAYDETEGGVTVLRCEVPLGDSCDDGVTLAAGSPYCESVLSCNVLMQSCPADLLACPSVSPPTCSAVDPTAFGDCTLSLGYAFDGTGCVPMSGCDCDPSCDSFFATRDECWTGCSRSCTDVVAARQDFYDQNDHCTTDADCLWVESGGPPYEHCSCMVAVNRNIDIGVWRALNFSYGCFEQGTCCDADPPPTPICNAGRCEAGSG